MKQCPWWDTLLHAADQVALKIYYLLGQMVSALINTDLPAGHHQEIWDASAPSNGMYVYELVALDRSRRRFVARNAMLLLE